MNIDVKYTPGLLNYFKEVRSNKYTDDDRKDLIANVMEKVGVVFQENDTIYQDGKVIVDNKEEHKYSYNYTKDSNDDILFCEKNHVYVKNGKSVDIEKSHRFDYYDKEGRVVKTKYTTRDDDVTYLTIWRDYDDEGNVIEKQEKTTDSVIKTKFNGNGDVISKSHTTIKSKMNSDKYRAYFDEKGKPYKIMDYDRNVEIDYERDLDDEGNVLSETIRFFDISSTNKKLISYRVISYAPSAGFKVAEVIENGILKEKYTYDSKGDEVEVFTKDGLDTFKRIEKSVDEDDNETILITESKYNYKGEVVYIDKIRKTYNEKGFLIVYAEDTHCHNVTSTYEYDEKDRRKKVITKKLINEEFRVINEINYTYSGDEDSDEFTRTRELLVYNEKGGITKKDIHTEVTTKTSESSTYEVFEYDKDIEPIIEEAESPTTEEDNEDKGE